MERLVLIFTCVLLGYVFRRRQMVPHDGYHTLNKIVTHICLPVVVVTKLWAIHIPEAQAFGRILLWPTLMPWLYFFIAVIVTLIAAKIFNFSRSYIGLMILLGGLGNTSFIGFPLIEAFYGKEGVKTGVLVDQLGSFFVVNLLGVAIASYTSGKLIRRLHILKKMVLFPPFLSLVFVLIAKQFVHELPLWLEEISAPFSIMLAPLALLSVGMQLRFSTKIHPKALRLLFACLFYKLILGPVIIYLVSRELFPSFSLSEKVVIFEAAMSPMVTAGIIATSFGLPSEESSQIVSTGTILCLLTLPLWYLFMG